MSATLSHQSDRIYLLRVSGVLKKSELDDSQANFAQNIAAGGPIRLLVQLEGFEGWERNVDWGSTEFFFEHRDNFEKIAIVGEQRWEDEALAFIGAPLRKNPVRFFPASADAEARAWIAE